MCKYPYFCSFECHQHAQIKTEKDCTRPTIVLYGFEMASIFFRSNYGIGGGSMSTLTKTLCLAWINHTWNFSIRRILFHCWTRGSLVMARSKPQRRLFTVYGARHTMLIEHIIVRQRHSSYMHTGDLDLLIDKYRTWGGGLSINLSD